jgi:hypothetical protein
MYKDVILPLCFEGAISAKSIGVALEVKAAPKPRRNLAARNILTRVFIISMQVRNLGLRSRLQLTVYRCTLECNSNNHNDRSNKDGQFTPQSI